ncbi:MAG: hypothetical protein JWQ96_2868 [Segetibacter sp.]|nr:hypothetical protein [Segetibacter sp.]
MQKFYFSCLLLFVTVICHSQINGYTFSSTTETYSEVSGGTILGGSSIDEEVFNNSTNGASGPVTGTGFPIGFNFVYRGNTYDAFAVATNGYIVLGSGSFTIGNSYTAIATTTSTGFENVVAGFNQDLDGTATSELSYQTTGSAPNRSLVVQWKNFVRWNASTTVVNFQIILKETSNTVIFQYGAMTGTTTNYEVQVGLKGASNQDLHNRTSTTSWANSARGTTSSSTISFNNTVSPPPGLNYTFTPSNCNNPTDITFTNTLNSATFNWQAPGAGGDTLKQYQWELRTSGVPFSGATGLSQSGNTSLTTVTLNGLTPQSGYTFYVRSTCLGGSNSGYAIKAITTRANDHCSGAVTLTVNNNLNCTSVYTDSTTIATESQPGCVGSADDDVWFKFTATNASLVIKLFNKSGAGGTTNTDLVFQIFSGTCGSLTSLACTDTPDSTVVSGLVVGNEYFVRVYNYTAIGYTKFDICIGVLPPAPANDDCIGAILLTPSSSNTCTTPTTGSTIGATPSTETPPSCSATGVNDDVWYKFVATSSTHSIQITNAANTTAVSVYYGACGGLTQVSSACASTTALANSLTIGETYFVRVYTTSASVGIYNQFSICIGSDPINDDCGGAISLNSSSATCTGTAGSTVGATQSSDAAPSCSATGRNDDVWYTFVASSTSQIITISNASSTTAAALYTGACGGLSQVSGACGSGGTTVSNLTVGQTYFVRVYSTSSTATTFSTYVICVTIPPANDECSGAISLSSSSMSCSPTTGSTFGGTPSADAAPTCSATGRNDDVWYSFAASATSQVITVSNASSTTAAAVYTGVCGGLTQITGACGSGGTTVHNLTVGETYFIRVYTTSSTVTTYSTFNICVTTPPPPPANDDCGNAVTMTGITNGTTVGATQTMAQEACGTATATFANDVWYKFTASANGDATLNVTNVASDFDAVVMVYSGACGALTNIGCADGPAGGGSETVSLTSLVAGQVYYARVYSFNAINGAFSISVTGTALPVSISNFKGSRNNNVNVLTWTTVSEQMSKGFELQRSIEGMNFSPITFIASKALSGNSNTLLSYSFVDEKAIAQTNYYRLKQVDVDNKATFSPVVVLKGQQKAGLVLQALYPIPANSNITAIIENSVREKINISIVDMYGKQVKSLVKVLEAGTNNIAVDVNGLATGSYVFKVSGLHGTIINRFIKN